MSKQLTPAKWKTRIDRSLKLLNVRMEEDDRFMRAYRGDYGIKPAKSLEENKDEMCVNFVYSYIETISPTIFQGMPRVFVEALNPESEGFVENYQAVINFWARTLGAKKHFMRCRFDSFFGIAGMLSEWDFEEAMVMESAEEAIDHIDPMTGRPVFREPKKVLKTIRDQPLLQRVERKNIILDPDSDSHEEDRWRGMRVIMTKNEFDKLDGVGSAMKNKIKGRTLSSDQRVNPFGGGTMGQDRYTEPEWVVLYKIYDLANEQVLLLPDYNTGEVDFVEQKEWPWLFDVEGDRFPLTIHEGKYDSHNPYPFSDFKAFWSQIQERNRLRTMIQSVVRRNAPGWLAKKGAMDEAEREKFISTKIGEYTECANPDGVKVKPQFQLTSDFFQHDQQSDTDVENVSGFNEYNAPMAAETATQSSIMEGRSNIRKTERKQKFSDFTCSVLSKMGQLCQQFQDEKIAAKIKTPDNPNATKWISVDRHEIIGEFGLTVKPGVDDFQDEGLKRQQTLSFATQMANNPNTDQRKLATGIAKVFGFEPDEILKPMQQVQREQQQQQQQSQQLQSQELQIKQTAAAAKMHPTLQFDKIDPATIPPGVLIEVLKAALAQNGVRDILLQNMGQGPQGGTPGLAPGVSVSPGSPSVAPPGGPNPSVPQPAPVNQAPPPMHGAGMPPPTPIQPISLGQGGPK